MKSPGCEISEQDGVTVARLHGDIDLVGVPVIMGLLRERSRDSAVGLAVDLSEVRYLDSAAMHMLFQVAQELSVARKGMAVALPPDSPITTLLRITSFHEVAKTHASLDEAVGSLKAGEFLQY